ncbi:hypothetical protein Sjap_002469 [Stephania japonica]|uniref:Uncharacterized protein n=1 Tax=Stephania japonica TaxID=461633 RepID=A0AAP0PUJ9_9MAGN
MTSPKEQQLQHMTDDERTSKKSLFVEALEKGISRLKIGHKVCALLNGGGYAEKLAGPPSQVLHIPDDISLVDSACFLESACTVWSAVFMTSKLTAGKTLLEIKWAQRASGSRVRRVHKAM